MSEHTDPPALILTLNVAVRQLLKLPSPPFFIYEELISVIP
jgi:hypothetical protein